MKTFHSLEEQYWDIYRPLYMEQYINPKNIEEEKRTFLEAYYKAEIYNPVFTYKTLPKEVDEKMLQLDALCQVFKQSKHPLAEYYVLLIIQTLKSLEAFQSRDTNAEHFNSWLSALYDAPSATLAQYAKHMLETVKIHKEEETMSSEELANIFTHALEERGFKGWKIVVEEMPARMSINQMDKMVKINKNATFSSSEVERLKVHEINTHILRAENAKKQPYLLFQYGFPAYLKTEEGLAILSEEKHGLLSEYDRQKYALRVLACGYALEHSFYEVFVYLHRYLDADDAFSMTLRVKRGMTDTAKKGGYTKDQVYLDGYLMLKEEPLSTISKLYYGKIGLENVKVLDSLEHLENVLVYPEWVKK